MRVIHLLSFVLPPSRPAVLGLVVLLPAAALGIIDRKFTPVDLVRQSETITAGSIHSVPGTTEWKLTGIEAVKGKRDGDVVLRLGTVASDQSRQIRGILAGEEGHSGLLFAATQNHETRAFLHVGVNWLALKAGKEGRWEIVGLAPQMNGVYVGGTDMLVRMSRYILTDPEATVPVAVGTHWADRSRIGTIEGDVAGMAAVELRGDGKTCLFVASGRGDRIFRPNIAEGTVEEITAAAKLDSRSRRFAWIDMNRDGLTDLVTWDGNVIAVRGVNKDGTFAPADPAWTFPLGGQCLGLAPASVSDDGAPAILVSTDGLPFLLEAGSKKTVLPSGKAVEELRGAQENAPSACIVADLDNDGFVDVLQPRRAGGILWKGKAGGFAPPARSPVSSAGGEARFALGDFDGDGCLDVFLSDRQQNQLWENDGRGGFRGVIERSGSLGSKTPPGVSDCAATDLNHDGRTDLALCYADTGFIYHFSRGYRCLGEESDLRLTGQPFGEELQTPGVKASVIADFNGDGALDLAVTLADGAAYCYYNEMFDPTGVVVRLPKGATGPVTVSVWQGDKYPFCTGTSLVTGHAPANFISARRPGECRMRYSLPGRPNQDKKVVVGNAPVQVVIGE